MSGPDRSEAGQAPSKTTGSKPRAGGGRRMMARDAIAGAAQKLGGAARLAAWAESDEKNEDKFWTSLYPKLIPLQPAAGGDKPVSIAAAIEAARKRAREAASLSDAREGAPAQDDATSGDPS